MDLLSLAATDDVVLAVKMPRTDEPLLGENGEPVTISFFNVDTPEYIAARNALLNKQRAAAARGKALTVSEELELGIEFLAAVTKGWHQLPPLGKGEAAPIFSTATARRVYSKAHWLRAQVDDKVRQAGMRAANFLSEDLTSDT